MGKDKLYHLIAGFLIGSIFGVVSPLLGLAMAVLIGGAKEVIWDKLLKKGYFEIADFVATCFGGVLGMVVSILIINYL